MISPTDAIISSPSQISSLPGELLGTASGPLSSQAKEDQLSTISSPQPKPCDQFGPGCSVSQSLMSPLLSPGAQVSLVSLPLSPSLGRDQLPLSPASPLQLPSSPLPSQNTEAWDTEDKSGEQTDCVRHQYMTFYSDDVAGPSNSSQDGPSWSPESDHTKQGRRVARADRM